MSWVQTIRDDPDVRGRLHALVNELDAQNLTVFTQISALTLPRGDGPKRVYVVRDLDGQEIIRIPQDELGGDPRAAILDGLAMFCVHCGHHLLEGEETICTTCEAREVMGLFRVWEQTS